MEKRVFRTAYTKSKHKDGEVNNLPSLTDASDFEPIERLVKRMVSGDPLLAAKRAQKVYNVNAKSIEELDRALDEKVPRTARQASDVDPVEVMEEAAEEVSRVARAEAENRKKAEKPAPKEPEKTVEPPPKGEPPKKEE